MKHILQKEDIPNPQNILRAASIGFHRVALEEMQQYVVMLAPLDPFLWNSRTYYQLAAQQLGCQYVQVGNYIHELEAIAESYILSILAMASQYAAVLIVQPHDWEILDWMVNRSNVPIINGGSRVASDPLTLLLQDNPIYGVSQVAVRMAFLRDLILGVL